MAHFLKNNLFALVVPGMSTTTVQQGPATDVVLI